MASQLKVDTLTGVTTAGSIAVTGEGNSTTTNLQQGLAKAWTHFQGTSTAASVDGLNISSVDDDGTGDYGLHFTNNMGNATYCVTFGIDDDGSASVVIGQDTTNGTMATGNFDFEAYYVNSSSNRTNYDYANHYMVITGDLA
tara:strand:- start:787 stop:1212 length:426 start_codon:yes stop_codon:yes gene_type:complete